MTVNMVTILFSAKKSGKGVNLLASLCDKYDASEDELRRVMEMVNSLIVNILKKNPCSLLDGKKENLAHIDTGFKSTLCSLFYAV